MASLALGLAGAGIGSLAPAGFTFLGMSGAGLGWTVGSALGSILFAPDGPSTQGPRLSDLSVQSSTRGAPIPKVYGTSRIAGNVIWTAGIQETATTQDSGGKGGGGATHTSYSYSCSFAAGLCEGEITGIRRIWADSVLIYNKGETASGDELAVSNQVGITIYTGSQTQEPDSLIEAHEGTGNVPAFRGLAYIVFDDLQLERYGNRIPNITCEVVGNGTVVDNPWVITEVSTSNHGYSGIVYADNKFVAIKDPGSSYAETLISTDGENWATHYIGDQVPGSSEWIAYGQGKFVSGGGSNAAYSADAISWTESDKASTVFSDIGIFADNKFVSVYHIGPWVTVSSDGEYWGLPKNTGFSSTAYGIAYGNGKFVLVGAHRNSFVSSDADSWSSHLAFPDYGYNYWSGVAFGNGVFLAVQLTRNEVYSSPDGETWSHAGTLPEPAGKIRFTNGLFYLSQHDTDQILYVTSNGSTFDTITVTGGTASIWMPPVYGNGRLVTVSDSYQAGESIMTAMLLDAEKISPDALSISSVITDICSKSGVTAISTTGITDTVHGYVMSQPMTARAALEPLITAYQCGVVESDYELKFTSLSGSPTETIYYEDLCGEVGLLRDVETEMPRRVTVSYSDKDGDYLPAVQSSQRIFSAGQIVNEVSAQFSLSSDADHMAKLSEKILYRAWTERESFDWQLTPKYAYLDAGDVITLDTDNSSRVIRITNNQIPMPGVIDFSGVATRASLYSSSVSGVASSYTSQSLVLVGDTLFEIMDLPALRDADATSAGFYVAVYGERANWTSGIVYRSTDGGSSWSGLVTTSTEATMGVTTDALGDGDHKTWDETNTVNISLYSGTLSSDTTANVLNGANAALVGDELIHFRTATLEGDGTYTLSGLLRGMKGTEHETDGHAIGDRFVLLNTTTIYRVSADYSKLNVTDKFKAVTNGQFLDSVTDTADVTFTNLNSKPLSPCQIYGSRDGSNNLTINWQRRSRLTETSLDDPGLGEASELYEVHIMSGGVAIRVIQSTTNSTTYTAAQQTADGLTPGDPVTVNIYQVSDTVGRGYVRSETI